MLAIELVILRSQEGDIQLTGWGLLLILFVICVIVALVDHEMDRYKGEDE